MQILRVVDVYDERGLLKHLQTLSQSPIATSCAIVGNNLSFLITIIMMVMMIMMAMMMMIMMIIIMMMMMMMKKVMITLPEPLTLYTIVPFPQHRMFVPPPSSPNPSPPLHCIL